jgi:hypothetical protein
VRQYAVTRRLWRTAAAVLLVAGTLLVADPVPAVAAVKADQKIASVHVRIPGGGNRDLTQEAVKAGTKACRKQRAHGVRVAVRWGALRYNYGFLCKTLLAGDRSSSPGS